MADEREDLGEDVEGHLLEEGSDRNLVEDSDVEGHMVISDDPGYAASGDEL